MHLVPVESSNLSGVGYDQDSATLYVEFRGTTLKNGTVKPPTLYAYDGVPPTVHQELMTADSKGSYLNAVVKPIFPCRKLEQLEAAA